MRRDGIPYVPNPVSHPFPVKDLEDMTLEEIVKKYIKTCGKADGNVAICSQCKSPCTYGKRAIQLLANKVYNDPPIPLYGGKTLIERAREENMKRKEQKNDNISALAKAIEGMKKNEDGTVKFEKKKKRGHIVWEGWWEESLASGDQVKWIMDNMNLTKTQAKKKIYQYKWYQSTKNPSAEVEKKTVPEEKKVEVREPQAESSVDISLEAKLEALMKEQEEYKKEMDRYQKLFNEAKAKYDAIKQKTDVLCSAMDIINE